MSFKGKNIFKNLVHVLILSLVLTSCFSEDTDESSGGSLFTNHAPVENLLELLPNYNGNFVAGNIISFTLEHPLELTVTGTPRLEIDINGVTQFANYVSGSGTNQILFQYTVQPGDNDNDGIEVSLNLDLSGGSITYDDNGSSISAPPSFEHPTEALALIDTTIPQIDAIIPPIPKLYLEGESVLLTFTFDEIVNVVGTPVIDINLDSGAAQMSYSTGSGTQNLIFEYTVTESDVDLNGFTPTTPITLAGGSIRDSFENDANLNFATTNIPFALINGAIPFVTNITSPAAQTYTNTDEIAFTLQFNSAVNITGNPRIEFNLGGVTETLIYVSGSGTDSLVFNYFVKLDDFDADGIELSNQIILSGGTIRDLDGDDAYLNFTAPLTPQVLVDAQRAFVTSIIAPVDAIYNSGEVLNFDLNFNQTVSVVGTPRLQLNLDSGIVYANYQSGHNTSRLSFSITIQNSDVDADGINLENLIDLNSGTLLSSGTEVNLDISTALASIDLSNILINPPNIDITSITPPLDDTYTNSENIEFIVNTSANVFVTGTPRISIDIGGVEKFATYQSGTGSNALIFSYTIEADLADTNGITLSSPLELNGGSIQSIHTVDLNLDFTPPDTSNIFVDSEVPLVEMTTPTDGSFINIANDSTTFNISGTCNEAGVTVNIEIDSAPAITPVGFLCDGSNFTGTIDTTSLTEISHNFQATIEDAAGNIGNSPLVSITKDITAPEVLSLTPPTNATYLNGESLNFTVTYSENITVSGSAEINLIINGETRSAVYQAGSGTSNLTFSYTIFNEEDLDGIEFSANTINLTSGSLDDIANNPANLALDATSVLPSLAAVLVDGILPTVSITSAPNITSINQNSYVISGECSENGNIVDVFIDTINVQATCSTNTWIIPATDVSSLADSSALNITANHQDNATNNAIPASVVIVKSVDQPLVSINSPQNITGINEFDYDLSGTCTEIGEEISIQIGSLSVTTNCSGGFWNLIGFNVSSLLDSNSILITADHQSSTGDNAPQESATISKDTTIPTVTIASAPEITPSNQTNYIISGTCSEDGEQVDLLIESLSFQVTCSGNAWTSGFQDVSAIPDSSLITINADHDNATGDSAETAIATTAKVTTAPTVSNLTTSSATSNTIDLSWNISDPGGNTLNDHTINFRILGTTTWLNFDDGVSTTPQATITGLNPSTTYEFRVALIYNTAEQSPFTNTAEGTTQPDSPLFDGPHIAMNVGGATDTKVVAFYDNTKVYINDVEIAGSPLSRGEAVQLTTAQFDVINADQPIYTAGRRGSTVGGPTSANITWNPTTWAGRTFNFSSTRSATQTLSIFAIENTDIEVRSGTDLIASGSFSAGTGGELSWTETGSYQIISTGTILAYHISGNLINDFTDPKPLLPSAFQIIGFPSNSMTLTTDEDATNYSLIHGNSVSDLNSINRDEAVAIDNQGGSNLYAGDALVISADQKISGFSYADSNGLASASFMPTNLMRKNYIINTNSDYVAFASLNAGTIDVYSPTEIIGVNTPIETLTLTRSGSNPNAPFNARRGTTPEGYRFIASTFVAAWYQPNNSNGGADQDETILYGTDL